VAIKKKYSPIVHTLTLAFNPPGKRLIEAAARICGVSSQRFIYNIIGASAESIVEGNRRAKRMRKTPRRLRG
jgi:uncharacterized protein (DUF1778 family)